MILGVSKNGSGFSREGDVVEWKDHDLQRSSHHGNSYYLL
jgi:hypothetical protein